MQSFQVNPNTAKSVSIRKHHISYLYFRATPLKPCLLDVGDETSPNMLPRWSICNQIRTDLKTPLANKLDPSTILYSTLLFSALLYSTLLYSTLLYYTMLYYAILYYTLLYYSTQLYYTVPCPLKQKRQTGTAKVSTPNSMRWAPPLCLLFLDRPLCKQLCQHKN